MNNEQSADIVRLERDIADEIRFEVCVGWKYGEPIVDGIADAAAYVIKLLQRRGLLPDHSDG